MNPKPGLTTTATIFRVRDADTLIVEIKRQFPVRLLDTDKEKYFNAPEKNTKEGKEASKFVQQLIKDKEVILFIPSKNSLELTDINSFDRILGEIWIDGQKLTDILYDAGYGEYKDY